MQSYFFRQNTFLILNPFDECFLNFSNDSIFEKTISKECPGECNFEKQLLVLTKFASYWYFSRIFLSFHIQKFTYLCSEEKKHKRVTISDFFMIV